ncbi:hypothetical protein SAMN02745181_3368 [Rubritalea squalenifaciens DSM 18772]|uniref:Carbohydrate binding module (Family 6) n=1 Tax=Rubritalea squalenifaciens DSM 18772 TaxID=1123071 RepID=A0A1M6QDJ4_9BACT|nr:hypothetical protein [Rubritalea squalenifaciens]SHK18374.1 hypothetical protein SAMN02745181_3368 [Rubritalea squalenifaciens DSM 18772]
MSKEVTHDLMPPVKSPNGWADTLVGILVRTVLVTALVVGVIWGLRWWAMYKPVIHPDAAGQVELKAKDAQLHGEPEIRYNLYEGKPNIGWWNEESQYLSWKTKGVSAGSYQVVLEYSRAPEAKLQLELKAGEQTLLGEVPPTGGWGKWSELSLGVLELSSSEVSELELRAITPDGGEVVNLVRVTLTSVGE